MTHSRVCLVKRNACDNCVPQSVVDYLLSWRQSVCSLGLEGSQHVFLVLSKVYHTRMT